VTSKELEQSLVLIKPDALKNSLTGYVLSQLSEFHTGLRFAGAKIVRVSRMLAEEHYAEHRGKLFYPSLVEYIMGRIHYPDDPWKRRVIAIVYQGPDAVEKIRDIAGPTDPLLAREKAEREIKLWFKPNDIPPLMHAYPVEESEEHYYFKNNQLYLSHEPGSACLLAPGDVVWKSDLEVLRLLYQALPAPCSLEAVAAKYLINARSDSYYNP